MHVIFKIVLKIGKSKYIIKKERNIMNNKLPKTTIDVLNEFFVDNNVDKNKLMIYIKNKKNIINVAHKILQGKKLTKNGFCLVLVMIQAFDSIKSISGLNNTNISELSPDEVLELFKDISEKTSFVNLVNYAKQINMDLQKIYTIAFNPIFSIQAIESLIELKEFTQPGRAVIAAMLSILAEKI